MTISEGLALGGAVMGYLLSIAFIDIINFKERTKTRPITDT
jgi:hypothetical protein